MTLFSFVVCLTGLLVASGLSGQSEPAGKLRLRPVNVATNGGDVGKELRFNDSRLTQRTAGRLDRSPAHNADRLPARETTGHADHTSFSPR
ncbi:hypothetical protein [Crateriforma conspicua]|uniref:hypothetical protein n=1 Tax=Crateriforma conspicua TaxID=2527996 RepID=UPI0011A5022F|nr:hypothetical protein [Crateriforma conspicua]